MIKLELIGLVPTVRPTDPLPRSLLEVEVPDRPRYRKARLHARDTVPRAYCFLTSISHIAISDWIHYPKAQNDAQDRNFILHWSPTLDGFSPSGFVLLRHVESEAGLEVVPVDYSGLIKLREEDAIVFDGRRFYRALHAGETYTLLYPGAELADTPALTVTLEYPTTVQRQGPFEVTVKVTYGGIVGQPSESTSRPIIFHTWAVENQEGPQEGFRLYRSRDWRRSWESCELDDGSSGASMLPDNLDIIISVARDNISAQFVSLSLGEERTTKQWLKSQSWICFPKDATPGDVFRYSLKGAVAISEEPNGTVALSLKNAHAAIRAGNVSSQDISSWTPTRQIKIFHPRTPGMSAYRDAIMKQMQMNGEIGEFNLDTYLEL
ncbi:hypothetical protein F4818DRAFT_439883 [Hypoxylon cercidicola]|nr:hypothetical protein F4818DRAFT_439883 [Hypoxylon cercidicola]